MPNSTDALTLGVAGFAYADLYCPERLRDLAELFYQELNTHDAELHDKLRAYLAAQGEGYAQKDESDILVTAAPYLSEFVARLFGVEKERDKLIGSIKIQDPIWTFKTFIARRAIKSFTAAKAEELSASDLGMQVKALQQNVFPESLAYDEELGVAYVAARLLDAEATEKPANPVTPEIQDRLDRLGGIAQVKAALSTVAAWAAAHYWQTDARQQVKDWVSFRTPRPFDHQHLVHIERTRPDLPEYMHAPAHEWRRRDGFDLTDKRRTPRQRLYEADYCLYCHPRAKDSCSKGFHEKDGAVKRNPLNVPLAGCPLDEKISEMHVLKKQGDSLAALAIVLIDNPMCPGTGHRVCNDCMTACIFQKQEPVNIPLSETGILTDVLELPYGYEIYSLLTRWHPLNAKQPYPQPYNGKNVLVVGLGPAGYTLAHYLLNEGFGVVGIDGLKIEPLAEEQALRVPPLGGLADDAVEQSFVKQPPEGGTLNACAPVKDFAAFCKRLDERILRGFGGVSEYGITARWDKNFLKAIYLNLVRREHFRAYGGVRFGGTLDADDAWAFGFDHIALATGAGKPTIVRMKNNLLRGIRKATDFLMALQLGGAFRRDLPVNLQMRLPAIVIGAGLTAFDNGTEAAAYYPAQVEKHLERHEKLLVTIGAETIYATLTAEEREIYDEFLTHGQAVRDERERAANAGEEPDFIPLVRAWGGVTLVYRKRLQDAPAYRLNHEEVELALQEGISFIEKMSPAEAVSDEHGAVKAIIFERQAQDDAGKWRGTGEFVEMPAHTVCVAAGTKPNNAYEIDEPGTFALDDWREYMRPHRAERNGDGQFHLIPAQTGEKGLFTSYAKDGHFMTFYGDDHPEYAGNVVKAMASAKHSYPNIAALFEDDIAQLTADGQAQREEQFRQFISQLDEAWTARLESVERLTPTIVALTVHARAAARKFRAGHFFKLQNYETDAPRINGARLLMEGLPLAGVSVDVARGTVRLLVEENGAASRIAARLTPGEPVMLMGPAGKAAEIPENEIVMLIGQDFGNALLLPLARAMREKNNRVLWLAAGDVAYLSAEITATANQVFRAKSDDITAALRRSVEEFALARVNRIIVAGNAALLAAVKAARHGFLADYLNPSHICTATLYTPMQCMLKEVCATCLHRQIDPATGREKFVYACADTLQTLDFVDLDNFRGRLGANSMAEKQTNLWLDAVLRGSTAGQR